MNSHLRRLVFVACCNESMSYGAGSQTWIARERKRERESLHGACLFNACMGPANVYTY